MTRGEVVSEVDDRLTELLKYYREGEPFPGGTMRVGRATRVKKTLVAQDEKDRRLGL